MRSFSKKEIIGFEKFLKSPFFYRGRNYVPLFMIIKRYYPCFDSPSCTLQNIYTELYQKSCNHSVMKTMLSGLTDLAEEFLIHNSVKNNNTEKSIILAGELRERKQFNYFNITKKEADKVLEKNNLRNYEYYYEKYMLAHESSLVALSGNLGYKDSAEEINLTETYFFKFIVLRFCDLYQSIVMNSRFLFNKPYDLKHYDLMMNYLTEHNDKGDSAVTVYYNFYMLLKTLQYSFYIKLKKVLAGTNVIFNLSEEKNFYVTMHNYLLLKLEDEKSVELREYLSVLNLLIDKGYLTQNDGYINPAAIANALLLADKNTDTFYLSKFVDDNIDKVNPVIRQSERFRFNAVIFFKKKMFDLSLKEASKVKTDNYNLKIFTDVLRLMNYYELNIPDPVDDIIKINLKYIKNHTEIPERKNAAFRNFADVYTKMIEKKFYGKEIDKDYLELLAEKINSPFRKKWILEKICSLK